MYKKEGLKLSLIIDNMLMDSTISQDTCDISNELPLFIGRRDDAPDLSLTGTVDELMIFRRALSEEEIAILFEKNCDQMTEVVDNYNPLLTPNDDGYNDLLIFEGLEQFPNNFLRIFNRHGHEVYKSDGAYNNDWGGTYQDTNEMLPDGTYYYVLDLGNGDKSKRGYITILNK